MLSLVKRSWLNSMLPLMPPSAVVLISSVTSNFATWYSHALAGSIVTAVPRLPPECQPSSPQLNTA